MALAAIRELVTIAIAIAAELPKLVRRAPVPRPDYQDPHFFVNRDRDTAEPTPEHCAYCRQARAVATKYCPGVPK